MTARGAGFWSVIYWSVIVFVIVFIIVCLVGTNIAFRHGLPLTNCDGCDYTGWAITVLVGMAGIGVAIFLGLWAARDLSNAMFATAANIGQALILIGKDLAKGGGGPAA